MDAGWLIPFLDKRVGSRQNCVNPVPFSQVVTLYLVFMFLTWDWPFLYSAENLLFSTLILGTVFSENVVFYGDANNNNNNRTRPRYAG